MKRPVCIKCGWSDEYMNARHLSKIQLKAKGIVDENGLIVDPKIKSIKDKQNGSIDLCWCPECGTFIELFINEQKETV